MKVVTFHKLNGRAAHPPLRPLLLRNMLLQQIQQMNQEDNGLSIFFKLKHLFFEEGVEDEQVITIIRQHPLRAVDKMLLTLTQFYSQQVEDIIEPLEEEKHHLAKQLIQVKQKLQNYMDDNQYFKSIIDRLEEERKDVEYKLNQSQSQIQRNLLETSIIASQNIMIKKEVLQTVEYSQGLLTENSQYQLKLVSIKKQIQYVRDQNKDLNLKIHSLVSEGRQWEAERAFLEDENKRLKEDYQMLSQQLSRKQEFIASFIAQYNKIHFFQYHQSFYQSEHQMSTEINNSHELKGFSFNQYDNQSAQSSLSPSHTSHHPETPLLTNKEQPISRGCLTAEKPKTVLPPLLTKICDSQQKLPRNFDSNEQKGRGEVKREESHKRSLFGLKGRNQLRGLKTLTKTVSSKNFKQNQGQVTYSDDKEKLNLEQTLRKKINEKSLMIKQLQGELNMLRTQFIEQRERITEVEGEYEIKLQQLKERVNFHSQQVNTVYQKYLLASSENKIICQRVNELEQELNKKQDQHTVYCQQLKKKCKAYIFNQIDQLESHHKVFMTQKRPNNREPFGNSSSSEELNRSPEMQQSFSLKVHSDDDDSPLNKMETSDAESYELLSSHYLTVKDLTLDLDFSVTNRKDSEGLEEIYARDTFQIQSDLGCFTERLVGEKGESRDKGHMTDRPRKQIDSFFHKRPGYKLVLDVQVFSEKVEPKPLSLQIKTIESMCFMLQGRVFLKVKGTTFEQEQVKISLVSSLLQLNIQPLRKVSQLVSNIGIIKIDPSPKQCYLKSYQCSIQYHRRELSIVNNYSLSASVQKNRKLDLDLGLGTFIHVPRAITLKTVIFTLHQQIPALKQSFNHQTQTQYSTIQKKMEHFELESFAYRPVINLTNFDLQLESVQDNKEEQFSLLSSYCPLETLQSPPQPVLQQAQQPRYSETKLVSLNDQNSDSTQGKGYSSTVHFSPVCMDVNRINENSLEDSTPFSACTEQCTAIKTIDKTRGQTPQEYQPHSQTHQCQLLKGNDLSLNHLSPSKTVDQDQSFAYGKSCSKAQLNRAILWGSSEKKQIYDISQSSLQKRQNQYLKQASDFRITPWQSEVIRSSLSKENQKPIPIEIIRKSLSSSASLFAKFVQKHRLSLNYQQYVNEKSYRRPQEKKRQLLIFKTCAQGKKRVFIMNSLRLFCLEDGTAIQMNKTSSLLRGNFMYGQSEVVLTQDGRLVISRQGKLGRLKGNIPDGTWMVQSYIVCLYRVLNQTA